VVEEERVGGGELERETGRDRWGNKKKGGEGYPLKENQLLKPDQMLQYFAKSRDPDLG